MKRIVIGLVAVIMLTGCDYRSKTKNIDGVEYILYRMQYNKIYVPLLDICPKCHKYSLDLYCDNCHEKQCKYVYYQYCDNCKKYVWDDWCGLCYKETIWKKRIRGDYKDSK